jgi:hypothetical protein
MASIILAVVADVSLRMEERSARTEVFNALAMVDVLMLASAEEPKSLSTNAVPHQVFQELRMGVVIFLRIVSLVPPRFLSSKEEVSQSFFYCR